jgi:hypothetical protein
LSEAKSGIGRHVRNADPGVRFAQPGLQTCPKSFNKEDAMPYMLLVMEARGRREDRPVEQAQKECAVMDAFADSLKTRGVYLASQSLRCLTDGTRVESRGGKRRVVDGPFAEAKELVGGFFLLDVATREQAVALAAECPAAAWASIEVREVGPCIG